MPFLALVVVVVIKTMVVAVVIVESVNFSFIVGVFSDVGDVLDVVDGSDVGDVLDVVDGSDVGDVLDVVDGCDVGDALDVVDVGNGNGVVSEEQHNSKQSIESTHICCLGQN